MSTVSSTAAASSLALTRSLSADARALSVSPSNSAAMEVLAMRATNSETVVGILRHRETASAGVGAGMVSVATTVAGTVAVDSL